MSISWTINKAINDIKEEKFETVAILININDHFLGFNISHWTALVIKKNQEGKIQALYNDSFGNTMAKKIPKLHQALKNNDIEEKNIIDYKTFQQSNSYDCGPWTVFNLHNMVKGDKPYNSKDDQNKKPNIKEQRLKLFARQNPEIQLKESMSLVEDTFISSKLSNEEFSKLNKITNKLKNIAREISLQKLSKISKKFDKNNKIQSK